MDGSIPSICRPRIGRAVLREQLEYALEFGKRFDVPVYVGEFTAQANPSVKSARDYLVDLLQIMQDEGLHWSYWEYSPDYSGVALYSENLNLLRPNALQVLEKYLRD
jgi:hypothetical protein